MPEVEGPFVLLALEAWLPRIEGLGFSRLGFVGFGFRMFRT